MTKFIYLIADIFARPLAFVVLASYGVIGAVLSPLLGAAAVNIVNISISVLTMIIGQAVLVSGVRDAVAFHVKLDKLLEGRAEDAIGLEHKDAEEIEEEREAVERGADNQTN